MQRPSAGRPESLFQAENQRSSGFCRGIRYEDIAWLLLKQNGNGPNGLLGI